MNYGELKAAVTAYAHRDDYLPLMPTFLALAEARIYTGEANAPKVRAAAMRLFTTLANGTRPVGFLEAIKVAQNANPDAPLEYQPLDHIPRYTRAYTWDGETLVLSKDQGFPVDLTYYGRLMTPVADADTNWILTNHPRVYLSAVLIELALWAQDDAMAAREAGNYISAVTALNSQQRAAEISGSPLQMQMRR